MFSKVTFANAVASSWVPSRNVFVQAKHVAFQIVSEPISAALSTVSFLFGVCFGCCACLGAEASAHSAFCKRRCLSKAPIVVKAAASVVLGAAEIFRLEA